MDDRTNRIDETTQDDAGSSLDGGINLEDGCGEDRKLDDTTRPDEADQTSEPSPDEEAGDDLGSGNQDDGASEGVVGALNQGQPAGSGTLRIDADATERAETGGSERAQEITLDVELESAVASGDHADISDEPEVSAGEADDASDEDLDGANSTVPLEDIGETLVLRDGNDLVFLCGDGVVVFGDELAAKEFADSLDVPEKSISRISEKVLGRLSALLPDSHQIGVVIQGLSWIAENSGYYFKLTPGSYEIRKEHGFYKNKAGTTYSMFKEGAVVKKWPEVDESLGALFTNPAVLTGVGGMMTQMALQQALAEVTHYLKGLDQKLDVVTRKIDDTNIADLLGAYLEIEKMINRRDRIGAVDEISWDQVSSHGAMLTGKREYCFRQMNPIVESLTSRERVSDINKALEKAKEEVPKWLVLIARIRQAELWLNELELDYRFDEKPDTYQDHLDSVREEQKESLERINGYIDNLFRGIDHVVRCANIDRVVNLPAAEAAEDSARQLEAQVLALRRMLQPGFERKSVATRELDPGWSFVSKAIPVAKDAARTAAPSVALFVIARLLKDPKAASLVASNLAKYWKFR